VDYIHFNPVKHGYVSKPQDWPYSSFNQAIHKGWYEPGVLLEDNFNELNNENMGNE